MVPVFVKVTLMGGNHEKRILNAEQIQKIAEKKNDMTGEIHSQINIHGNLIMDVEESPDQIKEAINATFKCRVLDIVSKLHAMGFIGH